MALLQLIALGLIVSAASIYLNKFLNTVTTKQLRYATSLYRFQLLKSLRDQISLKLKKTTCFQRLLQANSDPDLNQFSSSKSLLTSFWLIGASLNLTNAHIRK